jgi:NADH-quinone oxidoreductase subunit J
VKISDVTGPKGTAEYADWGGTKAVGMELFTEGLFPFEAISILLLIAVVGAVAIARPLKDDEASATGAEV